jgi:hypothetical protein
LTGDGQVDLGSSVWIADDEISVATIRTHLDPAAPSLWVAHNYALGLDDLLTAERGPGDSCRQHRPDHDQDADPPFGALSPAQMVDPPIQAAILLLKGRKPLRHEVRDSLFHGILPIFRVNETFVSGRRTCFVS